MRPEADCQGHRLSAAFFYALLANPQELRFDGNYTVDLAIWEANVGTVAAVANETTTPEPATLWLLTAGSAAFALRRRRT